MTMHDKPRIARRSYLRGAGVTLATLGGMTGSVVAKGRGVQRLADRPADILVYWSNVSTDASDPDSQRDFGYLGPHHPEPPGGLFMGHHDPAGGGLFDFSRIKMMPGGQRLQNKWLLMGGTVMATGGKPYNLVHQEGGTYQSVDQEMTFKARSAEQIQTLLGLPGLPPALEMLAGEKWRAVGLEYAKLATDDGGNPDPTLPEWGATRIDFYERKSGEYSLSLLYVLGADDSEDGADNPADGIPNAALGAGQKLIRAGRLNPGGQ